MASILDMEPPNVRNSDSPKLRQSRLVDSPSPYTHLLGTTVAFSGRPEDLALKAELSAFIGVVDAEISECRRRVDGLRAALITAEQDLAAAKTFRDLHISIFPPIHTLPPEVLSKIFQMVVGCEETHLWVPKCAGPWVLRQVCSYWRVTAESEPRLWRCFTLSKAITDNLTVSKQDTAAARLAQTLEWSGSQRLTFAVDLRLFRFSSSTDDAMPCSLKVLLSSRRRWYHAKFLGFSQVLPTYPRFELDDLNTLRFLTLTEKEDLEHGDFDLTALEKFAKAPKLRSLAITVLPMRSELGVHFPWSRLTNLELDFIMSKTINSLLRYRLISASPNLLTYHEQCASALESPAQVASEPIIICRHLQTLRMSGVHLLSRLECPQLKYFTLPTVTSTESSDLVVDFLTRSSPQQFTRLQVRFCEQQRPHLSPSLLALPTLEELVMDGKGSMTLPCEVLRYLATARPQVVPLLRYVEMSLDIRTVTVSRPVALTILEHLSTRARKSKLAQFSLKLYTSPSSFDSMYRDAGPKSDLGQFLSIFREASVPELEITVTTRLRMHEGK